MAPKRGGGGGGGGGISIDSSCPGAFQSDNLLGTPIAYFVAYCFFFLVYLVLLVTMSRVRKRHPNARSIIGGLYGTAVFFMMIAFALLIIATMLRECGTTSYLTYYNWAIAWTIFFYLAYFILLLSFFWLVNDRLRTLSGEQPGFFKMVYGIVLGFIGIMTAALIGLRCYNYWTNTDGGFFEDPLISETNKLGMAYFVFYLLITLAAGGLAFVTIVSMRSKRINTGDLTGWIAALTFSMFIWVIFYIVEIGAALNNRALSVTFYEASEWITDFFQAASFTILIFIAKSRAFSPVADTTADYNNTTYPVTQQPAYAPVPQQQYAYSNAAYNNNMAYNNAQPQPQSQPQPAYYYQQQPYSNNTIPVNNQPYVVHPK
ncbi:hypothetical protein BDV96DRAFT_263953 [Lophiotrema nucula]|uniref:Uncharacterized protein n=1 Tax=Lophiotrema nucula TaxID=690887 RepID=A0A6A5YMK4_9PLEO|nr:hypothetical protein BDV96DRAFT_263953 [Lophiotrema nucula]